MQDQKIFPHNDEAERGVLGSILIDEETILKVLDKLKPEDFYTPKNKIIFTAIQELYRSQQVVDILTLSSFLKKSKELTKVGGTAYLTEPVEAVPSSAHVENYSSIVKEASLRRSIIRYSDELSKSSYDEVNKIQGVIEQAEKGIFDISQGSINKYFVHVSELLEEAYDKAAELAANKDQVRGVRSGFGELDNLLGGFQNSDLVILAARPSVGKSALLLDFARHAGVNLKKSVGIFSLEMSNLQVMDRLLSMQVGIGLWNLRMGKLNESAFAKLGDAMGILPESKIFVDDTPGLSINELRTKCRRLKLEHGVDMIVIDYLQLLVGNTKESRVQEVSEISRYLKLIAKELDVPIIAAAQLSRAIEQRTDRRPQLSDLRESGSIEQDADIVMFLRREDTYNPESERKGMADLLVAKHRNGPTGDIELMFVGEQARFRSVDKKYSE